MKKLIISTIFTFLYLIDCNAVTPLDETSEFKTTTPTKEALYQENNLNIRDLSVSYDNISDSLNEFKVCQAKNMLYIGKGPENVDADGCVDIKARKTPPRSKLPKFAGFVSERKTGDLRNTEAYNTSDPAQVWGRVRADFLCYKQYTGARAMTYNDLKFMIFNIPWEGSDFIAPEKDDKIWLFDAMGINSTAEPNFAKNYVTDVDECDGWKVRESTKKGTVLALEGTLGRKHLNVSHSYCSNKELIACVYN